MPFISQRGLCPPTRWVTIVGHPGRARFPAGISENSFYGDPPARLSDVVSEHRCAAEVLGSDGVAKVLKNPEQTYWILDDTHIFNLFKGHQDISTELDNVDTLFALTERIFVTTSCIEEEPWLDIFPNVIFGHGTAMRRNGKLLLLWPILEYTYSSSINLAAKELPPNATAMAFALDTPTKNVLGCLKFHQAFYDGKDIESQEECRT